MPIFYKKKLCPKQGDFFQKRATFSKQTDMAGKNIFHPPSKIVKKFPPSNNSKLLKMGFSLEKGHFKI